jgi:hypothetical protein
MKKAKELAVTDVMTDESKTSIKIDFTNRIQDKLRFYEKFNQNKDLIEYAYIDKTTNNITYHTADGDIKHFPKERLNTFLINLYNKINSDKVGTLGPKSKDQKKRIDLKNKTSNIYYSLRMFGFDSPLFLLFMISKGLMGTLRYFGINSTKTKTKEKGAFLSVRIIDKDGESGFLNMYSKDLHHEYLLNGLRKEANKIFPIKAEDLTSTEVLQKYFTEYYSLKRYLNLKEAPNNFIDITTKKILKSSGYSTDFFELYGEVMPHKLINDKVEDITNLRNQRIRMSEAIAHSTYNVLQQGIIHMKNNKNQYNIQLDIDKNFITKELMSSGMLQYTQTINPLEELILSTKITKSGIGNMKKEQITLERRDLNPSYFGTISPSTTNEYGNIGMNQTLTNRSIIKDRFGSILIKEFNNNQNGLDGLSATDSLSPFFEFDDTTRRIMGNQQFAQFAQIDRPDEPLIQTGFEGVVPYLVSDRFAIKAKDDGKIDSVGDELKMTYKDGTKDQYSVKDRKSRTKRGIFMPIKYSVLVKPGEKIKKGQILAASSSLKSGKLAVGKNLVVALMGYRGMNYEDGWVAAESIGDKYTNTLYNKITIPIDTNAKITHYNIKEGQVTRPGETLIEYRPGNTNLDDIIENLDGQEDGQDDLLIGREVIGGSIKHRSPGGQIKEIRILLNGTQIDTTILNEWKRITKDIKNKLATCENITDPIKKLDCQNSIDNIESLKVGGHKVNNNEFDGYVIELFVERQNPIANGSKFALLGGSGGKGTIQYQIPRGKEPVSTETNLTVEFIPTPASNISRKNMSVVISLFTGKIVYFLNKKVEVLIKEGKIIQAKNLLLETYGHLDRTKEANIIEDIHLFFKQSDKEILNYVNKCDPLSKPAFPLLVTPFKNKITMPDIKAAAKVVNIPLNEKVRLPEEDNLITEYSVPVGIFPVIYLEHFPKEMAGIRANIKAKKQFATGQGRSGTKEGDGAIKLGVYDLFSVASKKASSLITELHLLKSDNDVGSRKLRNKILKDGEVVSQEDIEITEDLKKNAKTKKLVENYFIGALLDPKLSK